MAYTIQRKIQEIHDVRDKCLSEWECQFIGDIFFQVQSGKRLSDKQETIVEKLWDKVCESPY